MKALSVGLSFSMRVRQSRVSSTGEMERSRIFRLSSWMVKGKFILARPESLSADAAPEGALLARPLTVSLKRYPDTNLTCFPRGALGKPFHHKINHWTGSQC